MVDDGWGRESRANGHWVGARECLDRGARLGTLEEAGGGCDTDWKVWDPLPLACSNPSNPGTARQLALYHSTAV